MEKDPMAPAPASAPSSPTPDPEEEEQVMQVPEGSCTSEPEEAAHSEGRLGLVWGRYPAIPPGFACLQVNQTHAGLARHIPLGAQLDLHSLGSLEVTISHHYNYPCLSPLNHTIPLPGSRSCEWIPHSSCHS